MALKISIRSGDLTTPASINPSTSTSAAGVSFDVSSVRLRSFRRRAMSLTTQLATVFALPALFAAASKNRIVAPSPAKISAL